MSPLTCLLKVMLSVKPGAPSKVEVLLDKLGKGRGVNVSVH